MHGRFFIGRRNTHQADDRQSVLVPAGMNKIVGLGGQDAGFLHLFASVHLDQAVGPPPLLVHMAGQSGSQFKTVDGFDHIEQAHGQGRLVALQRSDQMQPAFGKFLTQLRPFGLCLLHPIFPENSLPGGNRLSDGFRWVGFGDGDQAYIISAAPVGAGGIIDGLFDLGQILCDVGLHLLSTGGPWGVETMGFDNNFGQRSMTLSDNARRLNFRSGFAHLPPAILMTDFARLADPGPMLSVLPAGALVLYRNYESRARVREAGALKSLCRRHGLLLIVAEDPWLAHEAGADGLHLGERTARQSGRARAAKLRPGGLLTVAAHSPAGLMRAAMLGADAALLSPVFETRSHPGATPLGVLKFVAWGRRAPLPVYALGGIDSRNARRLTHSGAAGIAGIGGWGQP
jgi:thiamine-phosphate pyrophosphorylase